MPDARLARTRESYEPRVSYEPPDPVFLVLGLFIMVALAALVGFVLRGSL